MIQGIEEFTRENLLPSYSDTGSRRHDHFREGHCIHPGPLMLDSDGRSRSPASLRDDRARAAMQTRPPGRWAWTESHDRPNRSSEIETTGSGPPRWGANWGANTSDHRRTPTNTQCPKSRLNSTIPDISARRRTLRTSMTRRGSGVQIPHGPLITCVSGVTPRRRSRPTGC